MVADTCNPSHLGNGNRRIVVQGQPWQKLATWWYMPVVPDTLEVEVGGSWFEAGLGKSVIHYQKNKLKTKGLGHGLSGRAQARVLTSIPNTAKKEGWKEGRKEERKEGRKKGRKEGKKNGSVVGSVVEHLTSIYEVLCLIPQDH
jgi:hypothetical protein